jgi:DNA-binding Xre family transcriptional regulator
MKKSIPGKKGSVLEWRAETFMDEKELRVLNTIKKLKAVHFLELSSLCEIEEPELRGIVGNLMHKNFVSVDRSTDDFDQLVVAREAAFRSA